MVVRAQQLTMALLLLIADEEQGTHKGQQTVRVLVQRLYRRLQLLVLLAQ